MSSLTGKIVASRARVNISQGPARERLEHKIRKLEEEKRATLGGLYLGDCSYVGPELHPTGTATAPSLDSLFWTTLFSCRRRTWHRHGAQGWLRHGAEPVQPVSRLWTRPATSRPRPATGSDGLSPMAHAAKAYLAIHHAIHTANASSNASCNPRWTTALFVSRFAGAGLRAWRHADSATVASVMPRPPSTFRL